MNNYKGKKVLILGLGLNEGGVGAAKFFAKAGSRVRVTDLKDAKILKPSLERLFEFSEIEYVLENHRLWDIDWADLIIRNQSIKPGNEFLEYAKKQGKEILTDVGIFLEFVNPKQIIGVTGTKGKSTTASLIYEILKHPKGREDLLRRQVQDDVVLAGNIGRSVLDSLDKINSQTLVILELSSFQLEAFEEKKVSPHIGVLTNIYPDHLNYYKDMDEYIDAKKILAQYQTSEDFLFINSISKLINNPKFLKGLDGIIIKYSKKNLPKGFKPKLKGEHNLENYAAAFAVSKKINIPEEEILKAFEEFEGVEFRTQLIKEFEGIKIYNDSAATIPDAAISALKTFDNAILICGGMNKGLKYEEMANQIDRSVKSVYFLEGDATESLKLKIKSEKLKGTYSDLEELMREVKKEAKSGNVILFSPGATSFNLFQNEFDRGRKFNTAVERVFK